MTWRVETTDVCAAWLETLEDPELERVVIALQVLRDRGPVLGRPLVDTVKASRFPNMKELRPPATTIRILFAFDPNRRAILLIGGDKSGRWNAWYREAIPLADALYAEELRKIEEERR